MREIKFRGKKIKGLNGLKGADIWRYGDLGQIGSEAETATITDIENDGTFLVDLYTVGQYTGVHDKDGREIYEGDIIENGRGQRHRVEYNCEYACFMARGGIMPPFMNQGSMNFYAVVGNIHDDPELLVRGDEHD